MMLMRKRRIALDEKARAPFAVLAVMIFLLSSFSVAYLGAITRQEMVNDLLRSDIRAADEIVIQLQNELRSVLYVVSMDALQDVLREVNLSSWKTDPVDVGIVNSTFQFLLEGSLSRQFPRRIRGHLVEETGHLIHLLPKVERVYDLVPDDIDAIEDPQPHDANNHSKIDTIQTVEYGPTNASHTYLAIGYLNISIYSEHPDLQFNRTLWLHREIEVPLPFLFRKMESFQSNSVGGFSDLSRLTKYILTTTAQFKAFRGYGMKTSGLPSELVDELQVRGEDATDVLTLEDLELAVNLALLLESAKTFRTWDPQVSEDLHNLLLEYSTGGTIDAADLAYLLNADNEGLNIEIMMAQAIYGVLDQFVLKYLDYTGLMPLVDEIWKGVQTVDGILQQAGEAIHDIWDQFAGGSSESWFDILEDWLRQKIVSEGRLDEDYFLRFLVGDRRSSEYRSHKGEVISSYPAVDISETGFTLEFVVRQNDESHTWYSDGSEQPHRFRNCINDSVIGYDTVIFTIEAGVDSPDHQMLFEEVNVGEGIDHSDIWLDFFDRFFVRESGESSTAESLRESIREVVLEIVQDVVRRAGDITNGHRLPSSVDPTDDRSFLMDLKYEVESAMGEIVAFYESPTGKEELKKVLASFSNGDLGLLEDLKFFLADEYDSFVNRLSVLRSVTETVAHDVLENHFSFEVVDLERIENTNMTSDWTWGGNVTEDILPIEEISHVFVEGGSRSSEQFTGLQSALIDDIDVAYQLVKKREVDIGTSQADKGVLVQVIDAAGEKAGEDIMSLFIGGTIDVLDGVGLLDMAIDAVDGFLEGMLEGSESSNAQYVLPLRIGEPFEFWEGDHRVASQSNTVKTISFQVDQLQNRLPAQWHDIDRTTIVPEGVLYADFNPEGSDDGDLGYDPNDILGKHYTDLLTFSERPFETKWNLTVLGRVPIRISTNERTLLGSGGHQPISLNRSIEVNFSTTIVVYTGWELEGVDYDLTSDLVTDIIDFLNVIWETVKEPLMDVIDYFQRISDFFRQILRTLLEYGSQAIEAIANASDIALTLLQTFLSNVMTVASDVIMNFLKDFGLEHFFIEFAGFTLEIKLTKGREKTECQCGMWVRARGDLIGFDLDFTTYLIEFEEPIEGMERYLIIEGIVGFGQGGLANVTIDPFMLIHQYMVEIHATDMNAKGDGWALDLYTPELDIYKNSGTSLSKTIGFVPTIPIPMLGVEVGVDFGVNIKHRAPDPGTPPFDFKLAMYRMLRESFTEAWQEIEMSFTLDFLEEFIRTAINKFIDKLSSKLEGTILEVVFYVDLAVGAIGSGGVVGGGFRLGFVVDRTVLFELLHWLVDTVEIFATNLHNPFGQSPYPSLPNGLPEYLGIRFEVYFGVGYPKMLRKLTPPDQSPKKMDLAISIQPNVPALMMLAGVDWGRWKIDFGAYLENFPLSSLSKAYTLSKGSVVDLYILQGQIHEVCGSCR